MLCFALHSTDSKGKSDSCLFGISFFIKKSENWSLEVKKKKERLFHSTIKSVDSMHRYRHPHNSQPPFGRFAELVETGLGLVEKAGLKICQVRVKKRRLSKKKNKNSVEEGSAQKRCQTGSSQQQP